MGNKRNKRSRRLAPPTPDSETHVETLNPGNVTLTNSNVSVQEGLGENSSINQVTDPRLLDCEIQVWTQIMEQKNYNKIKKMREQVDSKLEAILKEVKSNKKASTKINPKSNFNEIQDSQPSGSKTAKSIGVHASNNENSDSGNDDFPLRAFKMKDLKHPAKPLFRSESDVDVTRHSDEESDIEEDYHMECVNHFIDFFDSATIAGWRFFSLHEHLCFIWVALLNWRMFTSIFYFFWA